MEIEELKKKIAEQQKKVNNLNKFEKRMDFLDDPEVIEMYNVIHKEELILKRLQEQLKQMQEKANVKIENKL